MRSKTNKTGVLRECLWRRRGLAVVASEATGWTLVHVPSGYLLFQPLAHLEDAVLVIRCGWVLTDVVDWRDVDAIGFHSMPYAEKAALQDLVRSVAAMFGALP